MKSAQRKRPLSGFIIPGAAAALLIWLATNAFAADPVVSSVSTVVKASQHVTTVEITFTVADADGDACHIAVFGHDAVTREHFPMATFLEGELFDRTFAPGTHTVRWVASLDYEDTAFDTTNFVAYVRVSQSAKVAAGRYLVIDVSGGQWALTYPFEYKHSVDARKDVYKTDKIILRELPDAGWMGVYAVTQRQYELVTGATPSNFGGNPMRCVEMVSWDDITGTGGYSTGCIAALRSKTGLTALDMPDGRSGSTRDNSEFEASQTKVQSRQMSLNPWKMGLNPRQMKLDPWQMSLHSRQMKIKMRQMKLHPMRMKLEMRQMRPNPWHMKCDLRDIKLTGLFTWLR